MSLRAGMHLYAKYGVVKSDGGSGKFGFSSVAIAATETCCWVSQWLLQLLTATTRLDLSK